MKVIGEYAASVGCPTPLFSASEPIYRAALSTGYADQDTGAVCAVLEAMAGSEAMTRAVRSAFTRRLRRAWPKPATACASTGMCRSRWTTGSCCAPTCSGPIADGNYPVILTYGPYAKGLAFQDGYPSAWQRMVEKHPDVAAGSSNLYQSWEVVDPEKWVPRRLCLRARRFARRRAARPAIIDHFSPRETKDFYDCIEWAGVQPWSNGKVGLNGISYYGINQWHVASLQPPHLAAMCVWEGAADWYRDMTHHGGMLSTFWANWYDMQVKTVQYGAGERGKRSRVHGELVCGPRRLSEEQLAKNRCDFGARDPRASARRRLSQGALAEVGQDHGAAVLGGELGRTGPASARQFRRLRARRLEGQMARGARHRALDAFLHRLRPRAAAQVLRLLPEGRGHRLGQAAARAAAGAPSGREIRRARTRTNGRSRARKWTKLYLNSADFSLTETSLTGEAKRHLRRAGRRRHLHDAAAEGRDRDHRAGRGEAVRLVVDRATPTCSWSCACSRPT